MTVHTLKKYEDVNITAFLRQVVDANTKCYKTDFEYDLTTIREAARHPDGENNRLLWLSRRNGTECFKEHDVLLKETYGHVVWLCYADSKEESPVAYAVHVKGFDDDGRITGDLIELDYQAHVQSVKRDAEHVATVITSYEDGTEVTLPYNEWDGRRNRLMSEHGDLLSIRREAADEKGISLTLDAARAERERHARKVRTKDIGHDAAASLEDEVQDARDAVQRNSALGKDAPAR
jgi:hypothetical protein